MFLFLNFFFFRWNIEIGRTWKCYEYIIHYNTFNVWTMNNHDIQVILTNHNNPYHSHYTIIFHVNFHVILLSIVWNFFEKKIQAFAIYTIYNHCSFKFYFLLTMQILDQRMGAILKGCKISKNFSLLTKKKKIKNQKFF